MLSNQQTIEKKERVIKYVQAGRIKSGTKNELLISSPLGSCIAVVAYDIKRKIGAIAHVMLPGKSPENNERDKTRYAINAIEILFSKLNRLGASDADIEICLAGGANVLRKEKEPLTHDIINSVQETIKKNKNKICASSLGGFERRKVTLDIGTGTVYYTIGESGEKVLWEFNNLKSFNFRTSKNDQ